MYDHLLRRSEQLGECSGVLQQLLPVAGLHVPI